MSQPAGKKAARRERAQHSGGSTATQGVYRASVVSDARRVRTSEAHPEPLEPLEQERVVGAGRGRADRCRRQGCLPSLEGAVHVHQDVGRPGTASGGRTEPRIFGNGVLSVPFRVWGSPARPRNPRTSPRRGSPPATTRRSPGSSRPVVAVWPKTARRIPSPGDGLRHTPANLRTPVMVF